MVNNKNDGSKSSYDIYSNEELFNYDIEPVPKRWENYVKKEREKTKNEKRILRRKIENQKKKNGLLHSIFFEYFFNIIISYLWCYFSR